MTEDEQLWKRRFMLFAAVRIGGVLLILFGIGVAFTDWIAPGGWRIGGALLIAVGTIEMVVIPLLLRNAWERK